MVAMSGAAGEVCCNFGCGNVSEVKASHTRCRKPRNRGKK